MINKIAFQKYQEASEKWFDKANKYRIGAIISIFGICSKCSGKPLAQS
jgi:hypothetical protein